MSSNELPERFYRLLYFSPRPEDEERVCVGVLLYDSKNAYLEFDEKLEKAHCFAPDYDKKSLSFVLEAIRDMAEEAATQGKVNVFSPQFRLSSPRTLLLPVDDKVRSVLRHRYLLKPKSSEHRHREKGLGRRIDDFISKQSGMTLGAFRRQVTADDLFGADAVRDLPKDSIPRPISRAVIGDSEVLLLDGVDLHLSSELLVHRVTRVAHAFWQCKQVNEISGSSRRKKFVRAALVFNGDTPEIDASLKWRLDYALHELEKDADIKVQVGEPAEEKALMATIRSVAPPGSILR